MKRVAAIGGSEVFLRHLASIEAAEADRAFCRHGLPHLLDVARIAWIIDLERDLGLDKDVVYAAALLHDLGRSAQYTTGEPHDEAGARISGEILDGLPEGSRFDPLERGAILAAVSGHRGECPEAVERLGASEPPMREVLSRLIKEADGRSRACYACGARAECYWPDERKNLSIDV